jgi:HSP20 family protein
MRRGTIVLPHGDERPSICIGDSETLILFQTAKGGNNVTTAIESRRPDVLERLTDWFDTPDLFRFLDRPTRRDLIRVEQKVADGKLTVRAEMPGIDPAKDVDISVVGDQLVIKAERRETKDDDTYSEFRYGSFVRSLALPKGCKATDVDATYADGILTITVPVPQPEAIEPTKVEVKRP